MSFFSLKATKYIIQRGTMLAKKRNTSKDRPNEEKKYITILQPISKSYPNVDSLNVSPIFEF